MVELKVLWDSIVLLKKQVLIIIFGKEEYPANGDFDGTWGVYDEPFMQFYAKQLNSKKEPFFSTFFS